MSEEAERRGDTTHYLSKAYYKWEFVSISIKSHQVEGSLLPDPSTTITTTLALMASIRNRDHQAFRALYDLHGGLLFAIGLRLLRDRSDAEQLLIDVHLEVWLHADRYDPDRGNPLSYLILLTRSRALDRLRSRPEGTQSILDEHSHPSDKSMNPLELAVSGEQNGLVKQALAGLSRDERIVVEMSFLDGLTHAEIAQRLSKPLGTVKTHVRQGLIHLRTRLKTVIRGDQDSIGRTTSPVRKAIRSPEVRLV